jgi:hypothetical protein
LNNCQNERVQIIQNAIAKLLKMYEKREKQYASEIKMIKKKQWCWMCEKEATLYCCRFLELIK